MIVGLICIYVRHEAVIVLKASSTLMILSTSTPADEFLIAGAAIVALGTTPLDQWG
jgi:hypothetical protein